MASIRPARLYSHNLINAEEKYYISKMYQSKSFHASSYIDCGRQQAYGLLGIAATDDKFVIQYKRDAMLGEVVHGVLQNWAIADGKIAMVPNFDYDKDKREAARKRGDLSPAIEMPINEHTIAPELYKEFKGRYRLGGRVDGVLERKGSLVVLEIKTLAAKYMDNPSPLYRQIYLDKLYHFESQVQLYMHFLGAKEGIILAVNRDRFLQLMMGNSIYEWEDVYLEYRVDYNPLFIERELERLENLNNLVSKKELPDPEPDRGSCKFCNWRSLCPAPESQKK